MQPIPDTVCILSYIHVQYHPPLRLLHSDFGDFNNGVCHLVEITIAESKPDMDSLIQQTFCFSPDVLATAKDASNGRAAFFLACEDFGRMFDYSFPACVFFNFIFKVEISSRTLIPLVRRGSARSGRAS